jgi:hypothetical protein
MRLQHRILLRVLSATAVVTVASGALVAGVATPASATPNPLCSLLPALCAILPIGGTSGLTLPAGLSSTSPTSVTTADAENPVELLVTDPRAAVYNTAGGVSVTLTGPTSSAAQTTYTGEVNSVAGDVVDTTFNLSTNDLPAAPGDYTVNVGVASSSGLTSLLSLLGLSQLPLDTATFTIGSAQPTPNAALSVPAGGSVPATISTLTSVLFALGDVATITEPGSTTEAVPGLSLSGLSLTASSITGTLTAASDVPAGHYDLVVSDLLGQLGICSGCITVTKDEATALLIHLSSTKLAAGKSATLSGVLSKNGTDLPDHAVYAIEKTPGSKAALLGLTHTSSTGAFSFAVTPAENTVYAVWFNGDNTTLGKELASLSNVVGLTVTPKVTLKVKTTKVAHHLHGARLVASGKVAPTEAGKTVTLYNNGKRFGTAKIASNGSFRLVKKLVKRGHYALRAKTANQAAFAAAQSSVVHAKVS